MIKSLRLFIFLSLFFKAHGATILIDPGHGGTDFGAIGKRNILEKELALDISLLIYKKLKKLRYKVFLTRSVDRTLELDSRAKMAEKIKADLFISIHANSGKRKSSNGFETFYLDNHSDVAVKKVENVENVNLKGEDLIIHKILTDLVIDRTVKSSKALAKSIHNNVATKLSPLKMKNRGVKPGLFFVLALAKRPAVLLEMGFVSNPKELRKLQSKYFKKRYAEGVVKGINQFLSQ